MADALLSVTFFNSLQLIISEEKAHLYSLSEDNSKGLSNKFTTFLAIFLYFSLWKAYSVKIAKKKKTESTYVRLKTKPESIVKRHVKHMAKHNIDLPENMSADWSEETIDAMVEVAWKLEHMWRHAFGDHWAEVLDKERIKNWYKRM